MRVFGGFGVLVVAAVLAATTVVGTGSAEARHFGERISGNFVDVAVDTDGDGFTGNYFSGAARGSGNPSYEGVVEIDFLETPTGRCDAGQTEGDVIAYSIVRRYGNGDLLYSRLVDGFLCFDPSGTTTLTINAEFIGGTGRYANASGSYTADYVIDGLLPDAGGGLAHAAFYGRTNGGLS